MTRNMGAETRRIRELRRDIEEYLDVLGANITLGGASLARGSNGQTVMRTDQGKLVGTFESHELADFIRRAPGWLQDLSKHVEQLERIAFEQRVERRRMAKVRDALMRAHSARVDTPLGRRHVDDAFTALFASDDDFAG